MRGRMREVVARLTGPGGDGRSAMSLMGCHVRVKALAWQMPCGRLGGLRGQDYPIGPSVALVGEVVRLLLEALYRARTARTWRELAFSDCRRGCGAWLFDCCT